MDGGCVLAETELVWPDWKLLKGLKGQCVYCIQWNKDNASCLIRFITHCICVAWKWVFWIWKSYWPTVLFLLIVFGAFSVSVQTKALSTDPLRSGLYGGVLPPHGPRCVNKFPSHPELFLQGLSLASVSGSEYCQWTLRGELMTWTLIVWSWSLDLSVCRSLYFTCLVLEFTTHRQTNNNKRPKANRS